MINKIIHSALNFHYHIRLKKVNVLVSICYCDFIDYKEEKRAGERTCLMCEIERGEKETGSERKKKNVLAIFHIFLWD